MPLLHILAVHANSADGASLAVTVQTTTGSPGSAQAWKKCCEAKISGQPAGSYRKFREEFVKFVPDIVFRDERYLMGDPLLMPRVGLGALTSALVAAAMIWAFGPVAHAQVALPTIETRPSWSPAGAKSTSSDARAAVAARDATVSGDQSRTSFSLELSSGVMAEVFTLADPYRVIIDLPDVSFHLPAGAGSTGNGLVSAFRYGLISDGQARIVLDTSAPVLIDKAEMVPEKGDAVRLGLELVPTTPRIFGEGSGGSSQHQPTMKTAKASEAPPAPVARPRDRTKPVIVIDPGHGGVDPGAISPSHVPEKSVVLAVAKKLRDKLEKTGAYDVHMTRVNDVFIPLDKRVKISDELAADLFISIHADAIAQKNFAQTVRGATVYTLSERASDEEARLMAEKENASDAIAGLESGDANETGQVRNILIDLLTRETANFSADFSNTLVRRLKQTISLSRNPQKSAAFRVLRQSDTPSVLLELGYLSHAKDAELMNTSAWQRKVAASIANAVDSYFAKRTARAP